MTTETLKKLIEIEFERCGTISQFKFEVMRLIDLYESDKQQPTSIPGYNGTILTNPCGTSPIPDEVPFSEICSCNPKNGGSGICGCVIGMEMVQNPKKYGITNTLTSTKTDI